MATDPDADGGSTPPRQPGVGRSGFCGSDAKFVPIVNVALELVLEPSQLVRLADTLKIDLWVHPAKKVTWGPYHLNWFGRTLASEYQPTPPTTPVRAVVAIVVPLDQEPYIVRHVRSCGREFPGWSAELSPPQVLNIEDILVEEQVRIGFVERVKLHFDSLLGDAAADLADLPGLDGAPPQEATRQVVPTYDHIGVLALHERSGLVPSEIIRRALAKGYRVVFQLDNVHVNWTKQPARVPGDVEELSISERLGRVQSAGESYAAYWKRSIRESMEPEGAVLSARASFERQIQNGRARRESVWVCRLSEIPGIDDYDSVKIAHVRRWPIKPGTGQFGLLLDEDGSPGVIIPSTALQVPRAFAVELAEKLGFEVPPKGPSKSPTPIDAATAEQVPLEVPATDRVHDHDLLIIEALVQLAYDPAAKRVAKRLQGELVPHPSGIARGVETRIGALKKLRCSGNAGAANTPTPGADQDGFGNVTLRKRFKPGLSEAPTQLLFDALNLLVFEHSQLSERPPRPERDQCALEIVARLLNSARRSALDDQDVAKILEKAAIVWRRAQSGKFPDPLR